MENKSGFKVPPRLTAKQVRDLQDSGELANYRLIDVRTVSEYERAHIPGAELIPLDQFPEQIHGMDSTEKTILYCRSGNRSGAATTLLLSAGFASPFNMTGGILEWDGISTDGSPELQMREFGPDISIEAMAHIAWMMELITGEFYRSLSAITYDEKMVSLFDTLARAEQSHMNTVSAVYKNLTGSDLTTIEQGWAPGPQDIMEGGVSMGDALNWARGKSGIAILEYSMSLEARSYDLYLSMAGRVEDEKTSNMLAEVSREEWAHLTKMSALIEKLS